MQLAIYDGLIDYIATGEEPDLSETARMGFMFIRRELDDINAKYEARVAQNKANGSKGGAPKGNRNAKRQAETTETETEQPISTENNQNNPKQPTKTTSSKRGKKQVENAPETVDFVEIGESEESKKKKIKKSKSAQDVEFVEVANTTENNQIQPKTNETTLYDNMIYGELNIKFNSFNVVVDNAREVDFLEEFFSIKHAYNLDVLCMQEHTNAQTLAAYAQAIVAEWQLRGESHSDYKEAARHLINHLRRKFEADRRAAREEAAAPKSRKQAREDLMRGAAERLTQAIRKDGASPATADDTQPF